MEGGITMIKRSSITRSAIAILMGLALMAVVGAENRLAPSMESNSDTAKMVTLNFAFADGQWARVSEVEGGTIRIEENGKALALTPYIRDQGGSTVELKVFRILQGEQGETAQAVENLVVGKSPTKLDSGDMSFSVQVKNAGRIVPAAQTRQCCTRDCSGRLICGICVCTPCGVCFAYNWCDCPAPGPIE
jgi:hypothetical protein